MHIALKLSAAALAVAGAVSAHAARYAFDLTGSRTAMFTLDSAKPSFSSLFQSQFQNVSGSFGGSPGVATSISFGAVSFINSLDISGTQLGFTQFGGPLLISGPTSAPVFTPGTYQLSGIVSGNSQLTISELPGGVPEPAAWAFLAGGFALVGTALRRRATMTRVLA